MLPINLGFRGTHWTLALIPSLDDRNGEIYYIDPLGGSIDDLGRKHVELVHLSSHLQRVC